MFVSYIYSTILNSFVRSNVCYRVSHSPPVTIYAKRILNIINLISRYITDGEHEPGPCLVFCNSPAMMNIYCTFVVQKRIQLLFGNNHSQFVTAVNDKYDGMAFSEEEDERRRCN